MRASSTVRIRTWGPGDLAVLEKTLGDPRMTRHIGGPESHEKLVERQGRFERIADEGTGRMFKIIDEATGEAVGSVGYWDKTWHEQEVWETGWFVIPEYQGRGVAKAAMTQLLAVARTEGKHRYVHAFPSINNVPSNAIARSLGFTLLGEHTFEYPLGHLMQCNDWRLDLERPAG